jgi:glycosyltransferase involved in cell wall biosynthesis
VIDDFLWRMRRVSAQLERLRASVALRGWAGTLERMRDAGPRPMIDAVPSQSDPADDDERPRMLVIESRVPDPRRDAGSQRLQAMLCLLADMGWRIDLFSDMEPWSADAAARLAACGVRLRAGSLPAWLRTHGGRLDAVMLCRAPIAAQYQDLVRRHAPRACLVFDTVDLHFLREERAARTLGGAGLHRGAVRSRRRELRLVAASDLCLVVSEAERALLAEALPGSRIEVLSDIQDVQGRSGGFASRSGLLFIGGFGHPPNLDGMRWFLEAVWPHLLRAEPTMQLHVAGDLSREARALLSRERVVPHGRVDDLGPLLAACRVSIAPLRFGAGVKGKVNMAMSHGVPVVATSIAAEGMHLRDGDDVLVADDAEAFCEAVLRAYREPDLWMRLSDGGLANVERHFSTAVARRAVARLFPAPQRDGAARWA